MGKPDESSLLLNLYIITINLKIRVVKETSRIIISGPAQAYQGLQERFLGEFYEKTQLWFFRVFKSISLKPFLSFFQSNSIIFDNFVLYLYIHTPTHIINSFFPLENSKTLEI